MRTRTVADLRDGARRVLPDVELEQVYAVNCALNTHDRHLEPPFSVETELQVMGRQSADAIEVWAKYQSAASKRSDDESTPVWSAEVQCVAIYSCSVEDAKYTEDDLEAFAVLVGTPTLHPYAREWTQSLTSHSQYPAFTMGLFASIAEFPPDHEVEFPDRDDADDSQAQE